MSFLKRIEDKINFYSQVIKLIAEEPDLIRYLFSWGRFPLDSGQPWITFKAKEWLDRFLDKDMDVFEYGSGGSTIYFSGKVKKVVSVDHEPQWFEMVKKRLQDKKIDNCELFCVEPETKNDEEINLSTDQNFSGKSFKNYISKINGYPDNHFDLVVVDGRARNGCVLNSIKKVKNGGYILLDNSEREEYRKSFESLKNFESIDFSGPGFYLSVPWQTTVWKIIK